MIRLLPPITILADADEEEVVALEDWSRGLDWVHWMFESVRARQQHLHFAPKGTQRLIMTGEWDAFAPSLFSNHLGPVLVEAWQAAHDGHLQRLVELDQALCERLPLPEKERGLTAGATLLRSTRGARYQGVLGKYRALFEEGQTAGQFLIVWAAVGHFFQLSLANVVAEYLRLEWEMAQRDFDTRAEPRGTHTIVTLTSEMLRRQNDEARIRLLAEA